MVNFQSLRSDLLLPTAKEYERSASLLLELNQGAQKYYIIKRLFWEDSVIIDYCMEQLLTIHAVINYFDRIEYGNYEYY